MNRETVETYSLAAAGAVEGVFKYCVRPELTARRAWLGLAAGVIAYELACPEGELMSEGADRGLEKHPVLMTLGVLVVAGHVANLIPERIDLLHQGLKFLKH